MLTSTLTILTVLFFVVALLYSSVGHGGASGYLASMALMGVTAEVMRPTSLSLNVLVSSIAAVQFARAGHFRWRLLWPFAVASVPMAYVGGLAALPGMYYKPLLGAVLLCSAWRLAIAAKAAPPEAEPVTPPVGLSLVIGGVLGLVSGLSSTGGGIFLSPILLLMNWATVKQTAAVSAVFILVNSISGLVGWLKGGNALPPEFVTGIGPWAIAAVVGGLIGSQLGSAKLGSLALRRLLAAVLVIAGSKLIWSW